MIACERRNRRARWTELDPKYTDCTIRRYQEYTGNKATPECDGRTFEEIARRVNSEVR